jgi:hypothetical protein
MKASAVRIGHHNLISSSLGPFQSTLKMCLEKAIKSTLKELFDKAEHASSNQQETKLFEQYNLLKKDTQKLTDSVVIITQGMPDEITEQISKGDESIKLSILEEEELEISLALTQLDAVLDIKFTQYLFALEKRLKILFASKNITKENMPFGVSSVCWIYSQTFDLSESEVSIKSMIIHYLKKYLSVELLSVYKIIENNFINAGILPNIKMIAKPKIKQSPLPSHSSQAEQQSPHISSAAGQSQSGPGQQASGFQGQQSVANQNAFNQESHQQKSSAESLRSSDMVNSIFDLMNQGRTQNVQSPSASNVDNNTMDSTLDNLSKITSVAAGSVEVDKLKEMILEDIRSSTGIYYPTLNKVQQNTLDVMGMFYEQVKADSAIDNNMLSSLNAINLPLIRTAIKDKNFFDNASHPAREYLEKIIHASQKWHGTSVVKSLHKFSSSVASEYDGSTKSFNEANEGLDSFLRLTDRRAKKAEEKWVNAAKGKEKLEISRHKVQEIVENVSDNAVPDFVKNVIKYVIQDSLTLSLLRHGEDSDEWHKNINTSTTIAKMSNPDLIKELSPKQKIESLHHLDQTMDELGFSENDRIKTINNIKECANAATEETLDKDIKLDEVATINKNKQNVKRAGSVKIEELRELTAKEKSELTKIRLLPYGTNFDFITNQQRDRIRRKLSWFSPVSNKALFVSLLGKQPYEKSLNAVAIDLARKNILIVKPEKKKYFDKVLGDIFTKLKALVKK